MAARSVRMMMADDDGDDDDDLCVVIDATGKIFGVEYEGDTVVYDNAIHADSVASLLADSVAIVHPLMGGSTHWIGADETPSFAVEEIALAVFDQHKRRGAFDYCASSEEHHVAGVEYWFQTRSVSNFDGVGEEDGGSCILAHWDKDERAKEQYNLNLHPQLSTVTYLSNGGAPTLVTSLTTVDVDVEASSGQCEVVSPSAGRHLCFDGRKLHAAFPSLQSPDRTTDAVVVGSSRVTFLVNIWIGHKPVGIKNLPDSVARAAGMTTARGMRLDLREGERTNIVETPCKPGLPSTERLLPFSGGVGSLRCSLPSAPPANPAGALRFTGLRSSELKITVD